MLEEDSDTDISSDSESLETELLRLDPKLMEIASKTANLITSKLKNNLNESSTTDSEEDESVFHSLLKRDAKFKTNKDLSEFKNGRNNKESFQLASKIESGINESNNYFNNLINKPVKKKCVQTLNELAEEICKGSEVMEKSIVTPDFERKALPSQESRRSLKKQRRLERAKTKGDDWFGLPATEVTEETKNDLLVLQMRRSLDPKRFYKHNDRKVLPKYFQVGTVVETAADFYHSRVPKKHRKKTLVDELLADTELREYNKRKCAEIQQKQQWKRGAYKHMKRLKKRK